MIINHKNLTSLMLPKAPDSELRKDPKPLIEAIFNYQLVHLEAYIVHVDRVLRNEVAYKLTPDTIESLIDYHEDIHCVQRRRLQVSKSSTPSTWNGLPEHGCSWSWF